MQASLLKQQNGKTLALVQTLDESRLSEDDITVDVYRSNLNYKDTLVITGKGKIIRSFPVIPGIDPAGAVHTSGDPHPHAGQEVLLTGWDVGENHWDGLAKQVWMRDDWPAAMPQGLDVRKATIIGTAGLAAMLCTMALEDASVRPQDGEIAVMGASGGAGSTAVTLLYELDYQVVAAPGRESTHEYLESLGANRILPRDEFVESRLLGKQVWTGAIDTVGSKVSAEVLVQMNYGGCVAACGLVDDSILPITAMPFILCNIRPQGVDSVMTLSARRAQV